MSQYPTTFISEPPAGIAPDLPTTSISAPRTAQGQPTRTLTLTLTLTPYLAAMLDAACRATVDGTIQDLCIASIRLR